MEKKIKIEVEVKLDVPGNLKDAKGKPREATADDCTFLDVKIGDGQTVPLPLDAPCPRRFVKDLAAAAFKQLNTKG